MPGGSASPAAWNTARPRGWTGMITGAMSATWCIALTSSAAASGLSTLNGRCSVATRYRSGRPCSALAAPASSLSRHATSVSIIVFPTKCTPSAATLASQVADRLRRGDEQQLAELVGKPAVDLLRHSVVEAPQPRLDVRDRHVELGRCQRRPERGVDVAV